MSTVCSIVGATVTVHQFFCILHVISESMGIANNIDDSGISTEGYQGNDCGECET